MTRREILKAIAYDRNYQKFSCTECPVVKECNDDPTDCKTFHLSQSIVNAARDKLERPKMDKFFDELLGKHE